MAKYRKKPVVVEAFRLGIDPRPDWFQDKVTSQEITTFADDSCEIPTKEGVMKGNCGDYIIKEPFPTGDRDIYPCKLKMFKQTYEKAEAFRPFADRPRP